ERRPPPAVAEERKRPLAQGLERAVVGAAVEAAVAKRDPAGARDGLVEMAHRGVGLAGRRDWRGVERIILGLDRPALPRVPQAREALVDGPERARLTPGGHHHAADLPSGPG